MYHLIRYYAIMYFFLHLLWRVSIIIIIIIAISTSLSRVLRPTPTVRVLWPNNAHQHGMMAVLRLAHYNYTYTAF